MTVAADLILRNVRPYGAAMCDVAIKGGQILALGPNLSVSGPEIVCDGRDLIPGLHDHHLHLFATAARKVTVDLARCESMDAVCAALRQHAARLAEGAWLRATGLIEPDTEIPDRHMLDQWINDRPIRVQDRTGALWLLNSRAIDAIGPGPWPDCVERDASGRPTGRIWRGDVWLRSTLASPPPSLHHLSRELAAFGITSVTDAGASNGAAEVALFEAAVQSGELLQKLTLMGREDLPLSPDLERGPLKLLYDESALPDVAEVAARIVIARQHNRAAAAHCVTLGELLFFLAALDAAGGARPGDRIEHGSVIPQSLLADIARSGLTIVTQPGFVRTRGDRYLATIEPDDLPDLYRLRSLSDAGINVLAGSDAPYGSIDPWEAILAATKRTTESGAIIGKKEAIPLRQALGLYGADRGIQPGQAADLCLLGTPLSVLAEGWTANPVAMTIIGGAPFTAT
ncbi:amidohydrolase [Sphingorhabdus pulchriflava]|uniref:Amidohydrolase n=1 Tax=Sphingorhabdus pulchriflava TaxID=2292257 RepID=A0A371BG74_9SPHN|nr:amidohydrolase family protein [Sphingorhabdus pulchriflava]RDV06596.1 amidohydrolase [Sphingorhabdus pulchriflava]